MEHLGHFNGIIPSLVCISTKQDGVHSGKCFLKTLGNMISKTLTFKISLHASAFKNSCLWCEPKAVYYSLSACHLKTFWQPCSIHHIIMYFLIYSRLVTSVDQCWYLCSGPCLNSVNYWKWVSNFLSIWWAYWQWFFSQANHGTYSNPGANLGAQGQVVQSLVKITQG